MVPDLKHQSEFRAKTVTLTHQNDEGMLKVKVELLEIIKKNQK